MNFLDLTVAMQPQADQKPLNFPLSQIAPGIYHARVAVPDGPLALAVRDRSGATLWQGSIAETCGSELAALGADETALRRLAELTGGRVVAANQLLGLVETRASVSAARSGRCRWGPRLRSYCWTGFG